MDKSKPSDLFELRIYDIAPDRRNDMAVRFAGIQKFARMYEIACLGGWFGSQPAHSTVFVTLYKWRSFAERETKFARFAADADWQSIKAATDGISPLVQHYELHLMRTIGQSQEWEEDLGNELLVLSSRLGAVGSRSRLFDQIQDDLGAFEHRKVLIAFDLITGTNLPAIVCFSRRDNSCADYIEGEKVRISLTAHQ